MTKDIVISAVVVVLAATGAAVWVIHDNRQVAVVAPLNDRPTQPPVVAAPPPIAPEAPSASVTEATPEPVPAPARVVTPAPPPAAPVRRPNPPAAALITEPAARQALAGVGRDPQAEAVWIDAINDDNLSPNDRRNLIEDLNETGFADPRNLGPADLPVIEYRMALIEDLAPGAMDDVNYAAFEEAYRDLSNMRARLAGQ